MPLKPLLRFQDNMTKITLGTTSALSVEHAGTNSKTTEQIEAEAMMDRVR